MLCIHIQICNETLYKCSKCNATCICFGSNSWLSCQCKICLKLPRMQIMKKHKVYIDPQNENLNMDDQCPSVT